MRVIDADALIDRLDERKKMEQGVRNIADILNIQAFIDSQPTACDVSCGYNKEDIEINRKAAYNKAIDDFMRSIRDIVFDYYTNEAYIKYDDLCKIAEQLKAGAV